MLFTSPLPSLKTAFILRLKQNSKVVNKIKGIPYLTFQPAPNNLDSLKIPSLPVSHLMKKY